MPSTTRVYEGSGTYRLRCLTPGCTSSCITGSARDAHRGSLDVMTGREVHSTFRYLGEGRGNSARCRSCEQARRRARRVAGSARVPGMTREALGIARRFGVEFECALPTHVSRYDIESALRDAGLRTGRGHGWYCKGDGTIRVPGHSGVEVVSPPMAGDDGEQQVRTATRVLRALGAKVNVSCGTHVHHDANDLSVEDIKRAVRTWSANQPLIDGLVAQSRRGGGNTYCMRLGNADLARIEGIRTLEQMKHCGISRYRTLNLAAYGKYGTLEVRQHQGTLDAEKVLSWVRFGQAVLDSAKTQADHVPTQSRVRDLFARLGETMDETARTFLTGRAVEFGAVAA